MFGDSDSCLRICIRVDGGTGEVAFNIKKKFPMNFRSRKCRRSRFELKLHRIRMKRYVFW